MALGPWPYQFPYLYQSVDDHLVWQPGVQTRPTVEVEYIRSFLQIICNNFDLENACDTTNIVQRLHVKSFMGGRHYWSLIRICQNSRGEGNQNVTFFSTPVLMHGGLICITSCLSVCPVVCHPKFRLENNSLENNCTLQVHVFASVILSHWQVCSLQRQVASSQDLY